MMPPTWVERTLAAYRSGQPLALLFDYDGTLTPIVSHPDLATLPQPVHQSLAALAACDRVTVGVASGRPLEQVKALVNLPDLVYAGSGGMHIELAGEVLVDATLAEFEGIVDPLQMALSGPVRWFTGTWLERKPGCLAVHFRSLLPTQATAFVTEVRDTLAALAADCPVLRVREVSRALEISLAGSWTKGDAIKRMLGDLRHNAFVVYAGDSTNDEEAVALVNALGGLTIGVGDEPPTAARMRVGTQAEFALDLVRLAGELSSDPQPATVCMSPEGSG